MLRMNKYLSKSLYFISQVRRVRENLERVVNLNFSTGTIYRKEITVHNQKNGTEKKLHCLSDNMNDMNYKSHKNIRVGIIGGGLSPIYASVLLKQYRLIQYIHLVDIKDILNGTVFDAGQIDTSTQIKYYNVCQMEDALKDVDIVAIMDDKDFNLGKCGPRDQFISAANYIRRITEFTSQICPEALVAIFARPVTIILPFVSEMYKCAGCYNPQKIIGSTSIETMRIESETANLLGLDPTCFHIPIVAGADACTVVPLLSRAKPVNQFTGDEQRFLLQSLRSADNELATISQGPVLSTAAAVAKFIIILASGLRGCKDVIASAYIRSNVLPTCKYFASDIRFGENGIEENLGLPRISAREVALIEQSIPIINENVSMVKNIVYNNNLMQIKF